MIPVKLELHNFLAYRKPAPLDFTGLHLACLAGANGAGKSSLLDAITWSLWGEARCRDDELIHAGEQDMTVRLEFILDGNLYRVGRYRSRKGRGHSELTLEIQDGEDWRGIGESTIRATQDRITRLLRLDYPTFINSAFLVQGRADEFTSKTPGERKKILSEILGLDAWVEYEERAKDRLAQIKQQTDYINVTLQEIEDDLAREGDYQRELNELQEQLDALRQQVHEADLQYREFEKARRDLEMARRDHTEVLRLIQEKDEGLGRIAGERQQHLDRLESYREVLAACDDIEQGHLILQEARATEREQNQRQAEYGTLKDQWQGLQSEVRAARVKLETTCTGLLDRKAELEQAAHASGGDALAETQAKVDELQAREQQAKEWREQVEQLSAERNSLEGENKSLRAEMDHLDAQRQQIKALTDPTCPLCGQELNEQHRHELIETLTATGTQKATQYRANQDQIKVIWQEEASLNTEIKTVEQELRQLAPLLKHLATLSARSEQMQKALVDLDAVNAEIAEIETKLSQNDYALREQQYLSGLEEQMGLIGYDPVLHEEARSRVENYAGYEIQKVELTRAMDDAPKLEAAIAGLQEAETRWIERRAEHEVRLDQLVEEIGQFEAQMQALARWEGELETLREQERQIGERVGAARQKVRAMENQRERRETMLGEREALAEERTIYEELRLAFGKDGVPAMIIEAAIPEIEQEANEILARMTDGRMHIRFDTQRETTTGSVRETLEIKIADELGTRDYATFSGGEAFRVNFAVRLALSRLLARRAGAQLRTLIIDEGFGTQDTQGRERLVQALNSIQDEFDLILVITHIDELRDAFPARIEITKTPQGSQIELV